MGADMSTSAVVPVKPIELDSDFSGEDEYEDDTGDEGKILYQIIRLKPFV